VDGVYTKDPVKHPDAEMIEQITHADVLKRGIRVMDSTAITLCMDNNLPILVFDLKNKGAIKRALLGEKVGSFVGG
ncbi:MAG: UMP kinase, partial [Candidatus Magnetominusculus sp. LBB02]|nr:UMP kinase [Candidatus Magnetominusculus sp. LBB02]